MSSVDSTTEWELEIGGIRLPISAGAIEVGRDPECDLPIEDERASWRHLKIQMSDGTLLLTDLDSRNGTFVNGKRIDSQPLPITGESIIQIGSTRARLRRSSPGSSATEGRFRRVAMRGRAVRIGRAPDNDVMLDEPNVSWHHAELRPGNPPTLVDLGSRNGVRLDDALLQGAEPMREDSSAGIGPFSLRLDREELVIVDERGGLRLSADQISVEIDGRTILQPTSLTVTPGEFVALIGASGSGKTTLLKCLAGVRHPTGNQVMVGADPIDLRLTEVGYVPQSDVVHDRLTVRETLLYAARLRLPSDTRQKEHAAVVDDVLGELRLTEHEANLVGRLSGGQRKRVACGIELIGKPTMLLLDEPTSGLDPPLERRLMLALRRLADSGRGIVVVTHATSSLALCDTVAVMGDGGHLMFSGSPTEALEHFQVPAYDEIYGATELVNVPPVDPQAVGTSHAQPERRSGRLLSGRSLFKHTVALTGRYARTLGRDRRTLATLLGQAPLIGLLICLLYPADVLALPDHQPTRSAQFVFLLVTAALWLGLIDSCREIVKERPIIMRELAVGVRLDAQLIAKAIILFLLTAIQCFLLMAVVTAIQPLHASAGAYLSLTGLLILTSWSMAGVGLVISTVARSVDQASSVIPLLLIPQLLFGGALVSLARMGTAVQIFADLVVSRWAFAGAGHAIDMNGRLAKEPQVASLSGYGSSFFSLDPRAAAIILLGFTAAMLLAAAMLLSRRVQNV